MQPLITKRRIRGKHKGEVFAYQCGDCHQAWRRYQTPKHRPGCPRDLRDRIEHRTTAAYFKRPLTRAERARIAPLVAAAVIVASTGSVVEIGVRNRVNPNGLSVRLKALGTTNDVIVKRFIGGEWARQRGYRDAS